jgi:hypothetical protein
MLEVEIPGRTEISTRIATILLLLDDLDAT